MSNVLTFDPGLIRSATRLLVLSLPMDSRLNAESAAVRGPFHFLINKTQRYLRLVEMWFGTKLVWSVPGGVSLEALSNLHGRAPFTVEDNEAIPPGMIVTLDLYNPLGSIVATEGLGLAWKPPPCEHEWVLVSGTSASDTRVTFTCKRCGAKA